MENMDKQTIAAKSSNLGKNKWGVVLEGGGHRGIYTAGVLDVFLEQNLIADGVIGVSAGAIHGASYFAGQNGRSIRYTCKYCGDKRYMGFGSLVKTGDYFNADFCYRQLPLELDPYDDEGLVKADAEGREFYVVCTDLSTGKAVCKKLSTLTGMGMEWLRASASMPIASNPVKIDGNLYLDGGIADSVPLKAFEDLGYKKNIVVLTQIEGYKKKPNKLQPLIKATLKGYEECIKTSANRHLIYNESIEYAQKRQSEGDVLILQPSRQLKVGRTERDSEKIREMYQLGRSDALANIEKIKAFLGESK